MMPPLLTLVQLIVDYEWFSSRCFVEIDELVQGCSQGSLFLLCRRWMLKKDEDDRVFKGFPATNWKLTIASRR